MVVLWNNKDTLTEIAVQIKIRIQIFPGIIAHFPEQFFALLHGQAAAQRLVQECGKKFGKIPLFDAFVGGVHVHAASVHQIGGAGRQRLCGNGVYLVVGENTVVLILTACLLISAVCCIVAAVVSAKNNKTLADYMKTLENKAA